MTAAVLVGLYFFRGVLETRIPGSTPEQPQRVLQTLFPQPVIPWSSHGMTAECRKRLLPSAPSRPLSRDQNRTDRSRIKSGTAKRTCDAGESKNLIHAPDPCPYTSPCLFNGLSGGPSLGREQAGRGWGKKVTVLSWQVRWSMIPGTVDPGEAVRRWQHPSVCS